MAIYGEQQRRWTEQEDEQLRVLAKAGTSIREIGEIIGRSAGSVRNRAATLSIALARTPPRFQPRRRHQNEH